MYQTFGDSRTVDYLTPFVASNGNRSMTHHTIGTVREKLAAGVRLYLAHDIGGMYLGTYGDADSASAAITATYEGSTR